MAHAILSGRDHPPYHVIGLMSGTSADGVDAASIVTDGEQLCRREGFVSIPYPTELRARIVEQAQAPHDLAQLLVLEREITLSHVAAVDHLVASLSATLPPIQILGFHGHTVLHQPDRGLTCQLGNAALLATRTGVPVVSDFRRADMAAGGQGAPLAPLYHARCFPDAPRPLVVVNLGGVANVTRIAEDGHIVAGDTGPGCGVLDQWVELTTGQPFDKDGTIALQGTPDQAWVAEMLEAPFFQQPFPKSADRFDFSHLLPEGRNAEDGAASLCYLTVDAVSNAIESCGGARVVLLTGGGARHPLILERFRQRFRQVETVEEYGVKSDAMEAECFGWLAARCWRRLPTTLPQITGAKKATSGGAVTMPGPADSR